MNKFAIQKLAELKIHLAKSKPTKTKSTIKFKPPQKENSTTSIPKIKVNLKKLVQIAIVENKSKTIAKVFSQAKRNNWLNKKLQHQIGLPLAPNIRFVNVVDSRVFIVASNSSWGQRAKFATEDIIYILNPYFGGKLTKVSVKVKKFEF